MPFDHRSQDTSARPIAIGFLPDPDQQKRLVRESVEARQSDARPWALSPPTPEDRPPIQPVPDAYQGQFHSSCGG